MGCGLPWKNSILLNKNLKKIMPEHPHTICRKTIGDMITWSSHCLRFHQDSWAQSKQGEVHLDGVGELWQRVGRLVQGGVSVQGQCLEICRRVISSLECILWYLHFLWNNTEFGLSSVVVTNTIQMTQKIFLNSYPACVLKDIQLLQLMVLQTSTKYKLDLQFWWFVKTVRNQLNQVC